MRCSPCSIHSLFDPSNAENELSMWCASTLRPGIPLLTLNLMILARGACVLATLLLMAAAKPDSWLCSRPPDCPAQSKKRAGLAVL